MLCNVMISKLGKGSDFISVGFEVFYINIEFQVMLTPRAFVFEIGYFIELNKTTNTPMKNSALSSKDGVNSKWTWR